VQRQILLATDLSARSDRAFDRAVSLARAWDARLTIATALEDWPEDVLHESQPRWRRTDSELTDAESQIRDDLRGKDVDVKIVVRRARAPELIVDVARAAPHDLIVTGIARSTGLARVILGATVEALLRERVAPVLVVKRRARRPYRSALVGIDFSAGSGAALQATSELFPQTTLTVLHAYRETSAAARFSGRTESDDATYREIYAECTRFVAQTLPSASGGVRCVVEAGFPEPLLNQYAMDKKLDLMSVGTQGRNVMLDLLLGSTCHALILSSPCDLLLVSAGQVSRRKP
jgi:nucleotide-binding universal stress UspA family protein